MSDTNEQFYLDIPRMKLSLDGIVCNESPDYVKKYINDIFTKEESMKVMFSLTQTFIAKFYIEEYNNKMYENEHLLDGGELTANIDSYNKHIHIQKNFKTLYISDDLVYITNFCNLLVNINIVENSTLHFWNYDFSDNDIILINLRTDNYYLK